MSFTEKDKINCPLNTRITQNRNWNLLVEALVCGEEKNVAEMLEWLKHGPRFARVDAFSAAECREPDNLEPLGVM